MKTPLRLSALAALFSTSYASSPPVKVHLRSSWPAPPPLLECVESISLEEPHAFFPLLDSLTVLEPLPDSPRAWHHHALESAVAGGFLSQPGVYAAVEMDLALHAATPKIEAFYQYYKDHHAERRRGMPNSECESWVDWYGQIICDAESLAHLAGVETIDPTGADALNGSFIRPKLLPFDHVHPSSAEMLEPPPRTAILYTSFDSSNFRELHSYLYAASSSPSPHLEYVLRPIPSVNRDISQLQSLSGYGVALDLKKMDYLALDDRRQGSSDQETEAVDATESTSSVDSVAVLIHQYPENTTFDASTPLTDDELLEIGIQATQLVSNADEPLVALKQLAQNFPMYAASLARRVTVEPALFDEVTDNQMHVQGGINMAWLNGVNIAEKDMTPFGLLRLLRKERATMLSLTSLGLSPSQAIDLLTHPIIGAAQSSSDVLDGLFDASDRPEEGGVIGWLNDLTEDSRYARWGTSLRLLLRPMYPGQFANVRLNLYNVVLAMDLSQSSSLHFLATTVSSIVGRNYPFRFGIVPLVETAEGVQMARLFYFLMEHYGRAHTLGFLARIAQPQTPVQQMTPTVSWSLVRSEFRALQAGVEAVGEGADARLDDVLSGSAGSADLEKLRVYAARLGASLASASQGHVFVNGKHFPLDDDFLRAMQTEVSLQMQHLQGQLAAGLLSDGDAERIATYFYDLPGTARRRNGHIYPSGKASLRVFALPDLIARFGFPGGPGSFVYPPDSERVPLTTYIVADFDSEAGLELVREAMTSAKSDSPSRFSFVHNPAAASSGPAGRRTQVSSLLAHLVSKEALYRVSPARLLGVLGFSDPAVPNAGPQVVISPEGSLDDMLDGALLDDGGREAYEGFVKSCRLIARELEFAPGEQGLIVNGRVLGPMASGEFIADDFEVLMEYELTKRVEPVAGALEDVFGSFEGFDKGSYAEIVAMASSVVSSIQLPDPSESGLFNAPQKPRRRTYQNFAGEYTAYTFGDNSTALYHFGFLVDPLSEAAQKWSSLIEWLLNIPGVTVELHLNPARYREASLHLPLKRFYRYNLQPRPTFDENGDEIHTQTEFNGLAVEPIYTLAMDVPPSWLVRPREAQHDLDNIQLRTLSAKDRAEGLKAVFSLDDLVIEGHARDILTGAPPRGVQLQLVARDGAHIADTQVVANLGYLQFRTTPGVFRLEIRPGRGREIFRMESVGNDGWASPAVEQSGDEITLTSFEGHTLYPRLARLPGMERADVLQDDAPAEGHRGVLGDVMSRVSSLFTSKSDTAVAVAGSAQADINIFTVASGLLYERFASIMILGVLRNTKSSVKFWFIENFLSPSFLEFIPHFAAEYGFQYELVTYKWPSWLRAQKEKQRIIWAYKILFLDVLFPMDLKKVIFVDADQIVRADLLELVALDLHGAPYAYTPMGDDNVEMEGFRFWKTGYWREFLRGLPYHISALYVVDLVRFRQIAAGDMLRAQYQALSADPNSLANLDQDLPNNLQREVPIFSLPEDWLWCETWCDKERLHRAKTIDLCQNPLTKEPKLARARQIPEWEEYDAEIAQLARRLADEGRIRSGMAAADANALAEASAGRAAREAGESWESSGGERARDEL
ncbi:glycosyltransferase family 24 protein [Amylocystis lapponica]|nr:glycosyltransferase family 24 protein [Amylocystis lapponica]